MTETEQGTGLMKEDFRSWLERLAKPEIERYQFRHNDVAMRVFTGFLETGAGELERRYQSPEELSPHDVAKVEESLSELAKKVAEGLERSEIESEDAEASGEALRRFVEADCHFWPFCWPF